MLHYSFTTPYTFQYMLFCSSLWWAALHSVSAHEIKDSMGIYLGVLLCPLLNHGSYFYYPIFTSLFNINSFPCCCFYVCFYGWYSILSAACVGKDGMDLWMLFLFAPAKLWIWKKHLSRYGVLYIMLYITIYHNDVHFQLFSLFFLYYVMSQNQVSLK